MDTGVPRQNINRHEHKRAHLQSFSSLFLDPQNTTGLSPMSHGDTSAQGMRCTVTRKGYCYGAERQACVLSPSSTWLVEPKARSRESGQGNITRLLLLRSPAVLLSLCGARDAMRPAAKGSRRVPGREP